MNKNGEERYKVSENKREIILKDANKEGKKKGRKCALKQSMNPKRDLRLKERKKNKDRD